SRRDLEAQGRAMFVSDFFDVNKLAGIEFLPIEDERRAVDYRVGRLEMRSAVGLDVECFVLRQFRSLAGNDVRRAWRGLQQLVANLHRRRIALDTLDLQQSRYVVARPKCDGRFPAECAA